MKVPFEIVDAPIAACLDESVNYFQQLVDGALPVFAADGVPDLSASTLAPYEEIIRTHNLTISGGSKINRVGSWIADHFTLEETDFPLHIDGKVNVDEVDVSLHRTELGTAEAFFFEPTAEYLEADLEMEGMGLYVRLTDLFFEEQTDDRLFVPVAHRVTCKPDRLLTFRRGGARPLGHIFLTTTHPRTSELYWASSPSVVARWPQP